MRHRRYRRVLGFVFLLVIATGTIARAESDSGLLSGFDRMLTPRCLTPEAGHALSGVVASGALKPALGDEFTLLRGDLRGREIEVTIEDRDHHPYAITLALPGAKSGTPDGTGTQFQFFLVPPSGAPNANAAKALLAVAAAFDAGVPEAALGPCSGTQENTERRYPRSLILASALAQAVVILAAIVYGLRVVRYASD